MRNLIQSTKLDLISRTFANAREEGRGALIGFLTAGDPSPKYTPRLAQALIEGGIDILELGIPFSDPIADGRTIQGADVRALSAGTTPSVALELAEKVKVENEGTPVLFLTYLNPVLQFGLSKFLSNASEAGVSGLIVPDLPQIEDEEFVSYREEAKKYGMSTILLASPTTCKSRLRKIIDNTNGFLYVVSVLGVTGARRNIFDSATIRFMKKVSKEASGSTPVAAGFGISKPSQVRSILESGVDGIIVGSAFVDIIANNLNNIDGASRQLTKYARLMRRSTKFRA